jgi:hypothetical protein
VSPTWVVCSDEILADVENCGAGVGQPIGATLTALLVRGSDVLVAVKHDWERVGVLLGQRAATPRAGQRLGGDGARLTSGQWG